MNSPLGMSRGAGFQPARTHCQRSSARRGFTLLELVVSVAVSSMLIVGLSAATLMTLKAADTSLGPFANSHQGSLALLEMSRDLQDAITINTANSNATSVEFTVADRTGDGAAETIRYSWSGSAGADLQRTFNGRMDKVTGNVRALTLTHKTRTVIPASVRTESAETQFINQTSSNTGLGYWENVNSSDWVGEFIAPSLPSDAVDWKITRARLTLSAQDSATGQVAIQLRNANASLLPTSNVIDTVTLPESGFTGSFQEFAWSNSSELPLEGVCIVVAYGSGSGSVGRVRAGLGSLSTANTRLLSTSNAGGSWSSNTISDLYLQVWGTYTTLGRPPGVPDKYYRTSVDISLQVGTDTRSKVRTAVHLPNEPEVPAP